MKSFANGESEVLFALLISQRISEMLKSILFVVLPVFFLSTFSANAESITHIVQKDKLVKRGNVVLTSKNVGLEFFTLQIDYNLSVGMLLFSRNLKGSKDIQLPAKLLDPYGYEELEQAGSLENKKAKIFHDGRHQSSLYYDCHVIKVIPKENKGWDGVFTYCPAVPSIGFIKTAISIHKVPFVGRHTIFSKISGFRGWDFLQTDCLKCRNDLLFRLDETTKN